MEAHKEQLERLLDTKREQKAKETEQQPELKKRRGDNGEIIDDPAGEKGDEPMELPIASAASPSSASASDSSQTDEAARAKARADLQHRTSQKVQERATDIKNSGVEPVV